jgi:hypothetical protein
MILNGASPRVAVSENRESISNTLIRERSLRYISRNIS